MVPAVTVVASESGVRLLDHSPCAPAARPSMDGNLEDHGNRRKKVGACAEPNPKVRIRICLSCVIRRGRACIRIENDLSSQKANFRLRALFYLERLASLRFYEERSVTSVDSQQVDLL